MRDNNAKKFNQWIYLIYIQEFITIWQEVISTNGAGLSS